ncbi:ATP-dependent RNA helicase HrpB [Azospirillaceae bacterium]
MLPVESVLPELLRVLTDRKAAVLQASPGAGKTTCVPLALLKAPWLEGRRILVLEPRRLAARAAARRMAALLGEEVGATVGYRVRLESRVSAVTRIEVVTGGVFIRQIQSDPELSGVGVVVFDEVHERSLDSDLGLALSLETRSALREDLRLLAMSATLDGAALAAFLGETASMAAPVIVGEGRSFPIETRYASAARPGERIEDRVVATIRQALIEESGDILVFLPGAAEIRRVQRQLSESLPSRSAVEEEVEILPLYGDLPQDQQDRALSSIVGGRRKVVLSTSIAETSLTIEGIRVVVDSGLMRVPRFDVRGGMARLETVRASQAATDQRRGRAGRLEPGVCYRLWPEPEQRALAPFTEPEILAADLAPLALELALWGDGDGSGLSWLTPPPSTSLAQARTLLKSLGALDDHGRITAHGRRMVGLGAHPRLAHMILCGQELGAEEEACALAALLSDRDIVRNHRAGEPRDVDLRLRVDAVLEGGRFSEALFDRGALQQARRVARSWKGQLASLRRKTSALDARGEIRELGADAVGALVALAYPDRVAQRRSSGGSGAATYRLQNGRGGVLDGLDALATEEWLAVASLDGDRRDARIFLAAPLREETIRELFVARLEEQELLFWDDREKIVVARRRRCLGALILDDAPLSNPLPERITAVALEGVRRMGMKSLPWTDVLEEWRARVAFLRALDLSDGVGETVWPDLSDETLLATLEDWLAPFFSGVSRVGHFEKVDLAAALQTLLPWALQQKLEEWAPTHLTVPSGSRVRLDYRSGEHPILAVRLQEMFGLPGTPTIAGGRVPVLLHLLSPAHRPMQVTRDLAGFWVNGYPSVRSDLRGRYPRHSWPDDPLTAPPTARTKRGAGR